jgi:ketosteroid isomerase-like protein
MKTPAEEAVLAANRSFYAAFSGRSASTMERLWAKANPVACVHPGWDAIHGRDAVLASFRAILGSLQAPDIRASDEVVLFLGQTAMVTCTERIGEAELVATNVFFFEEGAWKMVHHHASPTAEERPSKPRPTSKLN